MKPNPNWNQNQINADIALRNRLFIPGWQLSHTLKSIRSNKYGWYSQHTVNLHYEEGKPVGVIVMEAKKDKSFTESLYINSDVQVFIRKEHRRKGIGTKLVQGLNKKAVRGHCGIDGSLDFWSHIHKNNLKAFESGDTIEA